MTQDDWRAVTIVSDDGLSLHARDYGSLASDRASERASDRASKQTNERNSEPVPVLCLAGLTRNSKDFHVVASRLAETRRVIVPDYRGRGLSDYARDWKTYQPEVEMADTIKLLDHLGIGKFAIIGTSRGGLIAMLMGMTIKDRLAGVVLNDIGPKLEEDGLIRIADSINKRSQSDSWREAGDGLKRYSDGFKGLSADDWLAFARNLYREKNGKIVPDYDFDLTKTFPTSDFVRSGRIPEAWELFASFEGLTVGVIRGENSDLLSVETLEKMRKAHNGLIVATVPNRAHVPFLDEPEAIDVIDQVLAASKG